jgi:hypothetical protein
VFTADLVMPEGDMRRVDFAAAAWDSFHSVNTPDDLTVARVLASRREARWKP